MIDPELVAAVRLQYGLKMHGSRKRLSQIYFANARESVTEAKSPTSPIVLWILLAGMFMPPTVAFFLNVEVVNKTICVDSAVYASNETIVQ